MRFTTLCKYKIILLVRISDEILEINIGQLSGKWVYITLKIKHVYVNYKY